MAVESVEYSSWITQLRKGTVELCVLLLLSKQEVYGYRIVQQLKDLGQLIAGEGTVYVILRRLEANDLVAGTWVHADQGNPRKYYSITERGRRFMSLALAEWKQIARTIKELEGDDNDQQ